MKTMMQVVIAVMAMAGVARADAHDERKGKMARKAPAKAVALPRPAAEIAAMYKTIAGTWRCKGDAFEMDGTKAPVTAVSRAKLDLGKFWIAESLDVRGKMPFKMTAYTTYDPAAKKWRRVALDSWGSYMVGSSDGMKDRKMTWNLDTVGSMGSAQFREHVDASARAGVKFWGEMSIDKGRSWHKVYEMTCRK